MPDYYKQIVEFENWKAGLNENADFISTIPEFDMEKNSPIEDDGNLSKGGKDDW